MSVYISAPSELRNVAKIMKRTLELKNIRVISRWLESEGEFKNVPDDKEQAALEARNNFDDMDQCSVFLALNPESFRYKGSGGRHVEFGYAVGLDLQLIVYGEKTCVFHYLPGVVHVEDPGDWIKAVQRALGSNA